MKKALKSLILISIAFLLACAVVVTGYYVLGNDLRKPYSVAEPQRPPQFPQDMSQLVSSVTRKEAEKLVLERLKLAGVSAKGYAVTSFVRYSFKPGIDDPTIYMTWHVTLYPSKWNKKTRAPWEDVVEYECYFGEVDAPTGELLYAGKAMRDAGILYATLENNGKEINAHLKNGVNENGDRFYNALGPGTFVEYYLLDGKIRKIEYLEEKQEYHPYGVASKQKFYTLDPKTGEITDELVYWLDYSTSYGDEYVLLTDIPGGKEYRKPCNESGNEYRLFLGYKELNFGFWDRLLGRDFPKKLVLSEDDVVVLDSRTKMVINYD